MRRTPGDDSDNLSSQGGYASEGRHCKRKETRYQTMGGVRAATLILLQLACFSDTHNTMRRLTNKTVACFDRTCKMVAGDIDTDAINRPPRRRRPLDCQVHDSEGSDVWATYLQLDGGCTMKKVSLCHGSTFQSIFPRSTQTLLSGLNPVKSWLVKQSASTLVSLPLHLRSSIMSLDSNCAASSIRTMHSGYLVDIHFFTAPSMPWLSVAPVRLRVDHDPLGI